VAQDLADTVWVTGAVNKPGFQRVSAGTTLADVLTLAGGKTSAAASARRLVNAASLRTYPARRAAQESNLRSGGRAQLRNTPVWSPRVYGQAADSSLESLASASTRSLGDTFDAIGAWDESSRIAPRPSTFFQKPGDGLRWRDSHWYTTALFAAPMRRARSFCVSRNRRRRY
jgi:hypothetical protein